MGSTSKLARISRSCTPRCADRPRRSRIVRCRAVLATGEDWKGLAGRIALAEAVVGAANGSLDLAEAKFQEAVEIARRLSDVWDESEALHLWGRALLDAGDRRRGVEKLDQALAIYRRIGAGNRWLERVLADKVRVQGTPSASVKTSIDAVRRGPPFTRIG